VKSCILLYKLNVPLTYLSITFGYTEGSRIINRTKAYLTNGETFLTDITIYFRFINTLKTAFLLNNIYIQFLPHRKHIKYPLQSPTG
jgi:hypothetical protein